MPNMIDERTILQHDRVKAQLTKHGDALVKAERKRVTNHVKERLTQLHDELKTQGNKAGAAAVKTALTDLKPKLAGLGETEGDE